MVSGDIHTPTMEGIRNYEGGGVKDPGNSGEKGAWMVNLVSIQGGSLQFFGGSVARAMIACQTSVLIMHAKIMCSSRKYPYPYLGGNFR